MSWFVETAILILQAVRTAVQWFVSFVVPTEKDLLHAAALRRAGKGGHVEVVRRLLQRHGNVDCYFFGDNNDNTRTRKTTLLHMASRENHIALLRALLVEHGANPNLPDCVTGASALATACALGHDDIVQLLLLQHPNTAVNRLDWNGDTALHAASRAGHARSVGLLLQARAADASLFVTNHQGQTPLACALQQGHVDVARLLVQHILHQQHDMSYFDEDDRQCVLDTLVHSLDGACSAGHTEVVRFILNHAEVQRQPRRIHEEALFLAASQGHDEIVRLLLLRRRLRDDNEKCVRATEDDDAMMMMSRTMNAACRNGHAAVVRLLLAHNGNSAYSRYCGTTTPLHCAAQGNHADIVQLLLQHDKQQQQGVMMLNARDFQGQTALHTAAKLGNGSTVRTLLLSGANSMICDDKGHLALELAAACCCTSRSSDDDDDNDNCGDRRRRVDAIYALVREEPHNIRFNHHR